MDPISKDPLIPVDKYGRQIILNNASLFACVAALSNTILGAGMLGLPHAFASSGYGLGLILLFLSSLASGFALHLLSASAKYINISPTSFYAVAHASVPKFSFLIDLAVAIKCFGVQTSYLIVVGDLMPPASIYLFGVDSSSAMADRRLWIFIFFIAIVVPLSCLRSLNSLRFTSSLSIIFVLFLTVIILIFGWTPSLDPCDNKINCSGSTDNFSINLNTGKVLSIFVFGFTCHQNIFPVVNELKENTQTRLNIVIVSALSIALSLYLLIAISGYHTFGNNVASNILNNYPDSTALSITRILVSLNVAFTFPLQCHPCRNSLFTLYGTLSVQLKNSNASCELENEDKRNSNSYEKINGSDSPEPVGEEQDPDPEVNSFVAPKDSNVYVPNSASISILTSMLCLSSFLISMFVSDLGVVLAVVGATGSTTISYILPGIVYLTIHPEWTFKKYCAALLFSIGCIIIPTCLTFIFI